MSTGTEVQKPRDAILEAAVKLFGRRGYAGTTMRDIAREVGVLPGSLYAHISSKEMLLDHIVESGIESFLAIEPTIPTNGTGRDRLHIAVKAHVAIATAHPGRTMVVLHQWRFLTEPNLARAVSKGRRYRQMFVRLIDEGIADGSFAPHLDTKIAVFSILGALNWIPQWYSARGRYGPEELGTRVADLILQGLAGNR